MPVFGRREWLLVIGVLSMSILPARGQEVLPPDAAIDTIVAESLRFLPESRPPPLDALLQAIMDQPARRKVRRRKAFHLDVSPAIEEAVSQVWNPSHFSLRIVPKLKDRGVSDEQIDALLVENPRRFFAGDKLPALAS